MPELKLSGRRILVVEDEYILAEDLSQRLAEEGATVLGPVPSVNAALDLLEAEASIDAAILDVNLHGEKIFPVADVLQARGVPFLFTTGYERSAIPDRYAGIIQCLKPFDGHAVTKALRNQLGSTH